MSGGVPGTEQAQGGEESCQLHANRQTGVGLIIRQSSTTPQHQATYLSRHSQPRQCRCRCCCWYCRRRYPHRRAAWSRKPAPGAATPLVPSTTAADPAHNGTRRSPRRLTLAQAPNSAPPLLLWRLDTRPSVDAPQPPSSGTNRGSTGPRERRGGRQNPGHAALSNPSAAPPTQACV